MEHVHIALTVGDVDGVVSSFELDLEVGKPWRARISARMTADVGPETLLGAPALFAFGRSAVEQAVAGIVTEIEVQSVGHDGDARFRFVDLVVESQLALLRETTDCRIFQEMDVKAIITQVLEEHGIAADRQAWHLAASYEPRAYCVQWNESALAFVTRLCEAEGIFFASELGEAGEMVVFSDDAASVAEVEGGPVTVRAGKELRTEGDLLTRVVPTERLRSGKVTLRDFAFETPTIDLESSQSAGDAREGEAELEQYAFARGFQVPAVAEQYAKVRLASTRADRRVVRAWGRCARARAGALLTLEGAALDLDGTYFVTRARHTLSASSMGGEGSALGLELEMVPKDCDYRLPQLTPRPVVRGPGVAFVTAPDGSETETVHTDEHGRVKVRFPWDRSGKTADDASCWMRVAQLQTSGSLMLPRVGWEVLVEHAYGDPDRPMVTGRVYNGATLPPYALPEGKSRTSLQTASSPGGGGRNEIRFEDAAGSEEVRIEAQKTHTLATAGNKDTKVGANNLQEVGGTRTIDISGSQTVKVTGGLTDGVDADQTVDIGGSRTINVNAARSTKTGALGIDIGAGEMAMIGNPLQGALDLAAAMAQEAVAARVNEAFEALDAAASGVVDQVVAPITEMTADADAIATAMNDIAGDPEAIPTVSGLIDDMRASAPSPSDMIRGALGSALPAEWGGAVPEAPEAEGSGGGEGGGESGANEAGPTAAVGSTEDSDDSCGPGHAILEAASTHDETVKSLRVVLTAGKVNTKSTGARTSDAGAAKVELIAGDRTEACDADKSEKAIGLVVLAGGNEVEEIEGARETDVVGAIVDKVSGSASLSAGGTVKMAGIAVRMKADDSITFKCGDSEVAITGGGIEFKSTIIQIAAATIKETKTTAAGT